ncbi:hypothetical protein EG68_02686 [Paragonimus skrjabini miyazakii]|uniref:Uncharacterized protein n=1 Tax=Paragonimus skrjabini miyazakii TaxID=59628 RepID=A0A8S9YWT7_9TREM|nr:hypothetical protein EG68_02686 [Paragonimus skrjabini miyazakii]
MSLGTEIIKDRSFGIPDPHTVTELSNYVMNRSTIEILEYFRCKAFFSRCTILCNKQVRKFPRGISFLNKASIFEKKVCSILNTYILLEEMASKIDSLEKNVADLMTQAGVQEG